MALTAPRRGSILFVVGGILLVLFLFATGFFRHMMMQNRLSHKQGEVKITSSTASSLATLAAHVLQNKILKDPASPLRTKAGVPFAALVDLPPVPLDIEGSDPFMALIAQNLKKPIQDQGTFSYSAFYSFNKNDFEPCGLEAFSREKKGLIRLKIKTNFKKTNDPSGGTNDEYDFACRIKITAAIVPVLSKFNLYIENAMEGGPPWKFNIVSTDAEGDLKPPETAKPFLLNNGEAVIQNRFDDFVYARRGLVYLGGGKMYLNLARGWGASAKFGEGFHLFAAGTGDGLYTIDWKGPNNDLAIMNWDQGICNDTTVSPSKEWWEFIENSPLQATGKMNSIFHLFGNELKTSPTLVLGQVYRSFIRARAFKTIALDGNGKLLFRPGFLPFISDPGSWQTICNPLIPAGQEEMVSLATFAATVGLTPDSPGLIKYQKEYASNLAFTPYNTSLAYMISQNREAYPLHHFGGDILGDFMKTSPLIPDEKLKEIPEKLRSINGVTTLDTLQPILNGLKIPGSRAAWIINTSADSGTLVDALKNRGLLRGNKLDLNGWVYFEGTKDLIINQNLDVVSNGGIVLQKGDIRIQNQIKFQQESEHAPVLQLVALDGSIEVNYNGPVDAALTAKERVNIGNSGRPTIRGAVAMGKFALSSASQGADLEYNPLLSALPEPHETDKASLTPLLGYSLDPSPIFLQ